jgi:hypothetical protein
VGHNAPVDPGVWIVASAVAVGLVTAFLLRTRLPAVLVAAILAAVGAGLGWGAMLIRDDPSDWEFVAAVALLAILVPAHVRIVLGRFGPSAAGEAAPAARPDEEKPVAGAP